MDPNYQNHTGLRLLSVNDARRILGVRHKTVTRLIQENKIAATKINNRYKITLKSLKDYEQNISSRENTETRKSTTRTSEQILEELIIKNSQIIK